MSCVIKRGKGKLSRRLTSVYALLFAAVLLLLSAGVFLLAYEDLIRRQSDSLKTTLELTNDHILE